MLLHSFKQTNTHTQTHTDTMNRGNERDWLEESFVIYDTLGDHKIDIILLGDVLRGLGLNPTEGEVQKIIKELESSGSNRYLIHLNSFI